MIKLFIFKIIYFFTAAILLILQGCSSQDQPLVEGVTTAVAPKIWPNIKNGSLFQERTPTRYGYQSLFEDRRPHNIGDTITIVLQENISASNSSSSNISRNGNTNTGITAGPNQINSISGLTNNAMGWNTSGRNNFSGIGSYSAQNKFTGLITVTVQQVLPNGNLKVVGEKQVAINDGVEFIRFSGVVNPDNISKNNLVTSTQISDSRIEYLSHGRLNNVQKIGWLQRFLMKISPI